VTRPIFFASLIIITAYLPLFSFERAEAKLFTPMAYTMGYALFGALLTRWRWCRGSPIGLSQARPRLSQPLARAPDRGYDRVLAACLDQPRIIYGVAIFALLAVVGLGARSAAISCRISTRARCGCRCRCPPAWR
jgi:heavy metal efflux system protein